VKILKIVGGFVLFLVLVLVGLGVFFFSNINKIIKDAVETYGPEVTQTSVLLNEVDVDLANGSGELNRFSIGNPKGFSSDNIVKWEKIRLQLDTSSLTTDVIVIKDFVVEGVAITAEQKGLTTNIQALMENLQSQSSGSSEGESSDETAEADIRLMVERIRFADNSINLVTEKFGAYELPLPGFELANIGDRATGLTPEELGAAILKPLLKQAKTAVEEKVKGITKEKLKEKLDEKKEELKAKAKEKEEELKAKADEKKKELLEKHDIDEEQLQEKEDEIKAKAKDKLKGLFN